MAEKVIVLGGGVAGLSAAHELAERGFDVSVYERRSIPGGKARSVPVPQRGPQQGPPFPGEHGFRFFPGFYTHVTDTMKRIPVRQGMRTVYDHLVDTTRVEILRKDRTPLITISRFPRSLRDLRVLADMFAQFTAATGLTKDEIHRFLSLLWQFATSCADRRWDEYEKIGWWEFTEASRPLCSQNYRQVFAAGLSRSLVAAQPTRENTRTGGTIFLQLLFSMCRPSMSSDRVLNGPTNEVWINPWLAYLRSRGVDYHPQAKVLRIDCVDHQVIGVHIEENGRVFSVEGRYYVAALPIEVMAALLKQTPNLLAADPTLEGVITLSRNTAWMNGIQFYLFNDVPLGYGHQLYLDSPWALTSLSQAQFWPEVDLAKRGDGKVKGIISVDISDWKTEGVLYGKRAVDCSRCEIRDEVWEQLKQCLNGRGARVLKDSDLHSWFLDDDIVAREYVQSYAPGKYVNLEPLLVNTIDTWHLRPDAYTRISNLFLAADYVRTYTDLATMEAANEAARRAVNAIVDRSGRSTPYCQLWELREPWWLEWWKRQDRKRYARGLPWSGGLPWWLYPMGKMVGAVLERTCGRMMPEPRRVVQVDRSTPSANTTD